MPSTVFINWLNRPEGGICKLNIFKLDVYTAEDEGNFIGLLGIINFNMVTYSIINKLDVGSLIACIFFFFFTGWFTEGGTRDNSIKESETSTYLQALPVDWDWYTLFFGVGVLFRGRAFWPHRYASF